jgi:diguanylate cyclase (GGDEF)-like protein
MTDFLIYNSLNFYSLVILVVIYFQARKFLKTNDDFFVKIWLKCIMFLFVVISADILSWLYISNDTGFFIFLSKICNCVIYSFLILLTSNIALFVDYNIKYSLRSYKFLKKLFLPLIVINIILSLLSFFFDIYFTFIDGEYRVGSLNLIFVILVFLPILITIIRIFMLHKEVRQIRNTLLLGFILPMVFLVIHRLNVLPFTLYFSSLTFLIIIYNSLLINNNLSIDYLTNLQNRRGIEKYFSGLGPQIGHYLAVLFIDVNGFKSINDKFGHAEGDFVLAALAKMILKVTKISDLSARVGGDEFLIAIQGSRETEYQMVIHKLFIEIDKFNESEQKPYKLEITYGVCLTPPNRHIDKDTIIKTADNDMYKRKREKKEKSAAFDQ